MGIDYTKPVQAALKLSSTDTGARARLRSALSPTTQHRAYPVLAEIGIDISVPDDRQIALLVFGILALSKASSNGPDALGVALRKCVADNTKLAKKDPIASRLQRLVACRTISDTCRLAQPVLKRILADKPNALDYARLLKDLHRISKYADQVHAEWMMQFYGSQKQLKMV